MSKNKNKQKFVNQTSKKKKMSIYHDAFTYMYNIEFFFRRLKIFEGSLKKKITVFYVYVCLSNGVMLNGRISREMNNNNKNIKCQFIPQMD